MKTVSIEQTTLDACIKDSQNDRVLVTEGGKPVALIVGIEGLDSEQLQLASSQRFWKLIEERRKQRTLSREELERRIESVATAENN